MITVEALHALGHLGPLDVRFARAMADLVERSLGAAVPREALLAAALASRQLAAGDVCVDLAAPPAVTDEAGAAIPVEWPEPAAWAAALAATPLVARPGEGETPVAPLVLDAGGRLYLRRLWRHQSALATALRERAERRFEPRDARRLRSALARLFADADRGDPWQRVAALTAVLRGLTVVTGGPGTGKTATVVRLLALLAAEGVAEPGRTPRVLLLAPTGKAAARLTESIARALPALALGDAPAAEIGRPAATIHRALGAIGSSGARFRHHAENPLLADVVVVDEASMVDLALMSRLMSAVPRDARLVLLGDRDQLASVEAGAVLGDLCDARALERGYSAGHLADLARFGGVDLGGLPLFAPRPGLRDSLVRLARSYRYGEDSGIARLARAIREQDADAALEVLESAAYPDVVRLEPPRDGGFHPDAEERIAAGFAGAVESEEPASALGALERFRVLCAHRTGPFGVERANARVVELLRARGSLPWREGSFHGRAILVTRNDYTLELFNGDVGVVVRTPGEPERLSAAFAGREGRIRLLSPARLPAHETAFAMTVHKSQGSEVDRLVLVLPEASPLVTRELLYTAVTRARSGVVLQASRRTVEEGIRARTRRTSGLRDLLWEEASPGSRDST